MDVKRALISVYDKTGIVDFAKELAAMGWEIISTGGTAKILKEHAIEIIEIAEVTGFPECFDGRVKTLDPHIHGGILALRDEKTHMDTVKKMDIKLIDMVVNNLYPFKATVLNPEATHHDIIENIDIGGPAMLRAAAKNYPFVATLVDPDDYANIIKELKENGEIDTEAKALLAAKVFQYTSHYDTLISEYFSKKLGLNNPEFLSLTYEKKQSLRYGENPHQEAAFYVSCTATQGTLARAEKIHGKELSFNNINDGNGALEALKEFDEPTVVAVKHTNPCGIGSADTIEEAFKKAYEADKQSIFGGIIAANGEIDEATAKLIHSIFIEVVIAPSFSDEALKMLTAKKNIRLLRLPDIHAINDKEADIKKVMGGILVQQRNDLLLSKSPQVVTKRAPTTQEMADLYFAWKVVKHTRSNAIVLARDKGTVAIGPGQVSRIWALENAIRQGEDKTKGSVMASDAFFPFRDCVEVAAKAGITAIIQPGGSIKDQESIDAANQHGIAMVFTQTRHFKH